MLYREEANGVVFFRSGLLGVRHGFSTRLGGVSTLPHTRALNPGFYRGDERETVLENLGRFAGALDMPLSAFVSVTQIHSAEVREVGPAECGAGIYYKADFECDGYVTADPGVALCIKIADCVPNLFSDPAAGVIGAVHAGWRGTAAGIAAVCVEKLCALGARRENIRAAIGPSIGVCCYEVGEDFAAAFREAAVEALCRRFVLPLGTPGRYRADLRGANHALLRGAGLRETHIDTTGLCTACRTDLFYSHRARGGTGITVRRDHAVRPEKHEIFTQKTHAAGPRSKNVNISVLK